MKTAFRPGTTSPAWRVAGVLPVGVLAGVGLAALPAGAANPAAGLPAPGQYRIDSESTMTRSGPGPMNMKTVQKVDGATGGATVTYFVDGKQTSTQTAPGSGAVQRCVTPLGASAPPPALAGATACDTKMSAGAGPSSTYATSCPNVSTAQGQWRQIDATRWEHRYKVAMQPSAMTTPSSPRAAIQMALAHMSPAERAEAEKELANMPTASQRSGAINDTLAQMEEAARTAPPAEAAQIRQQMAMMKGGAVGAFNGTGSTTWDVTEVWTRTAGSCSAAAK